MKHAVRKKIYENPSQGLDAIIDKYKDRSERTSSLSLDLSSDSHLMRSMISSYTWRNSSSKSSRAVFADFVRPSGIIRIPKRPHKL